MASLGTLIPYFILAVVALVFLGGSVVALRGHRWWATVTMTVGSVLQLVGSLGAGAGTLWMMMRMSSMTSSGAGASASAYSSAIAPVVMVMIGGGLVIGLGFLLFGAGFLGFCGRYAAAERRARELEEIVEGLQQRMEQ